MRGFALFNLISNPIDVDEGSSYSDKLLTLISIQLLKNKALRTMLVKWINLFKMDSKNKKGGSDRLRINVNQDYELRDWSDKFGVSPDELKRAVEAVGTFADDVERFLKK